MSTDLRCPCGQRVGFRHQQMAVDVVGFFYDLGTGMQLEICPSCRGDLEQAFNAGELRDIDTLLRAEA